MATWDAILSHYSFDSKYYSEISEPVDLIKVFVDLRTGAFRLNSNRFIHQAYHHVLSPILTTTNTLYDFPVSVKLTYLDVISARRQRILFSKYQNNLSLYNHSDFIKMHMHNAWLLGKSDLTIELLSDYFTMPKYLSVFCGTLTLNEICDNRDANDFTFTLFCSPLLT